MEAAFALYLACSCSKPRAFRVAADSLTTYTPLLVHVVSYPTDVLAAGPDQDLTGMRRVHAHVGQQRVERDRFWQLKIAGAEFPGRRTLPPGRGLQAASASERDGPNHWPPASVRRHSTVHDFITALTTKNKGVAGLESALSMNDGNLSIRVLPVASCQPNIRPCGCRLSSRC